MTNYKQVEEFHQTFGLTTLETPTVPPVKGAILRKNLIAEEYKELMDEIDPYIKSGDIEDVNLCNVAKEAADLLYVVYGLALDFGIDADAVFAEVHSSNMSKLDDDGKPIYNEHGKVTKSHNYRPANMKKVLGL